MMLLRSRTANGRLIIELSRQHISATHILNSKKLASRVIKRTSADKLDFANSGELVARMNSTLRVLGLRSPQKATICIPRSIVCIHVLELPHIGQRDLASAINLEMESVYGEENSQFVWDFVTIGAEGKTPMYAIVFCVPKRILVGLRDALEQSHIGVERITLSELGYGPACHPHVDLVHMLALRHDQLNVMICLRGSVVQFQTFTINPATPCDFDHIKGTLRRLHASLPESMQTLVPRTMLLLSHADTARMPCEPSEYENSLVNICQANEFAIESYSVEELFDFSRRSYHSLDLANPRKPASPPMSRRSKGRVLLAIVAVVASAFWGFNQFESAKLSEQIEQTREKIAESDKKMTALSSQLDSVALLNQWDESNVNWSKQISAVSQKFAENDDCYVVRLQMDNQNALERKPVTRIEGRGKTSQRILQLTRKLSADNPALSVQPSGIEPSSVDPDFNSQFRIEITEAVGHTPATTVPPGEED